MPRSCRGRSVSRVALAPSRERRVLHGDLARREDARRGERPGQMEQAHLSGTSSRPAPRAWGCGRAGRVEHLVTFQPMVGMVDSAHVVFTGRDAVKAGQVTRPRCCKRSWACPHRHDPLPHCPKVSRVMRSCVWFLRAGHGLAACWSRQRDGIGWPREMKQSSW